MEHLEPGDIIKYGHHMVVVVELVDGGAVVRDQHGQEGWIALPHDVPVAGRAGEGLFAHL
jgi:hypothetical protein